MPNPLEKYSKKNTRRILSVQQIWNEVVPRKYLPLLYSKESGKRNLNNRLGKYETCSNKYTDAKKEILVQTKVDTLHRGVEEEDANVFKRGGGGEGYLRQHPGFHFVFR